MTTTLIEHSDVEQRSEEWHTLRRGIISASEVGQLIVSERPDPADFICPECKQGVGLMCVSLRGGQPIKTIHSARIVIADREPPVLVVAGNDTSRGLIASKAAERIAGWTEEGPMSSDMWRGVMAEPFARDAYNANHPEAREYGYMVRQGDGWQLGYSPDGLVGDDGLIEIKAPRAKTHLRTVLSNEVPARYVAQCQAALLVSGRAWLDFIPYVGGMPLWVKRVRPDPEWHAVIIAAAIAFEASVSALVADYTKRVEGLPVTERIDPDDLGLVF